LNFHDHTKLEGLPIVNNIPLIANKIEVRSWSALFAQTAQSLWKVRGFHE